MVKGYANFGFCRQPTDEGTYHPRPKFLVVSSATARAATATAAAGSCNSSSSSAAKAETLFATRGARACECASATPPRYGLLKLEPSFISTFRLSGGVFRVVLQPFYLVDTSNSPTAGRGFLLPQWSQRQQAALAEAAATNNRKQGEKVQWYRNHNGESS